MKRIIISAIVITGALAALVSPAEAAPPERISASATIADVDPCTGDPDDITLHFDVAIHDDGQGATVLTIKSRVETSRGWSGGGTETQLATPNHTAISNLAIRVTNSAGDVAMIKGHRKIDLTTGDVLVDTHRLICVRSR